METNAHSQSVKNPAVAGMFYPDDTETCLNQVQAHLAAARPVTTGDAKIIIAPHAGYQFSGPIAGTIYAPLKARREIIKRVVLLGPAHRVGFKGLATTSADCWASPLGITPVDWNALRDLLSIEGVKVMDPAFAEEHSMEVHLPFLQECLGEFELVPLLVGDASHGLVAQALDRVWGGQETLIVISSDLSHFHDYDTARGKDHQTSVWIETMDAAALSGEAACGHRAVGGALLQAKRRDLRVTAVDVRNSGDTYGNKGRVVGYGSYAMEYAEAARLAPDDKAMLIDAAKQGLRFGAEHGRPMKASLGTSLSPCLTAMRATFVTVKIEDKLRGCIGSLIPHRPLILDVIENAYKAGFGDPRFDPMTKEEMDRATIDVSVLSTPRPIAFANEAELIAQVRPDKDGLILHDGQHRGLFLPSVWSGLPKAEDFIRNLKRKAGLPMDHWSDQLKVSRYTTESFGGIM